MRVTVCAMLLLAGCDDGGGGGANVADSGIRALADALREDVGVLDAAA